MIAENGRGPGWMRYIHRLIFDQQTSMWHKVVLEDFRRERGGYWPVRGGLALKDRSSDLPEG